MPDPSYPPTYSPDDAVRVLASEGWHRGMARVAVESFVADDPNEPVPTLLDAADLDAVRRKLDESAYLDERSDAEPDDAAYGLTAEAAGQDETAWTPCRAESGGHICGRAAGHPGSHYCGVVAIPTTQRCSHSWADKPKPEPESAARDTVEVWYGPRVGVMFCEGCGVLAATTFVSTPVSALYLCDHHAARLAETLTALLTEV